MTMDLSDVSLAVPSQARAAAQFPFHGGGEQPVATGVAQDVAQVIRVEGGDGRAGDLGHSARDQELSHGGSVLPRVTTG
ncbi:MAG TPA: hypothetical protein VN442_15790 [Bryobacteraceae bacterium]|nr:hypothetical protein [Bryobacteraceae bacterium]